MWRYFPWLKPLLNYLSKVAVSPAKSSMGKVFPGVFVNLKKSHLEPLLITIGLRTSVKYHGFQNLRKIPWVSKPLLNTMSFKISVK